MDSPEKLLGGQACMRRVVKLLAGDDMDVVTTFNQVRCEIADEDAGGRLIRQKKSIEEEDPCHEGIRAFLAVILRNSSGLKDQLRISKFTGFVARS
ncbi:MAG: hypothetical protein WBE90_23870 [Xanthobacteraceae bacterium]